MKKHSTLFIAFFIFVFSGIAQNTNSSNSLLWRIEGNGIEKASYLFGTIHLPQKRFINYSDSVYSAIQGTDIFFAEVDLLNQPDYNDTSFFNFLNRKIKYIDSVQKTEAWKRMIDKINRKYQVELDYTNREEFIRFSQQLLKNIFEADEDVITPDIMLATHARMLGKRTGELESIRTQIDIMYTIIDARLQDTTIGFEDEVTFTEGLKEHYINERLDSLAFRIGQIHPTYRNLIFDNRNRTMADSIEKHVQQQSSFFAIGAGHLCGQNGLIGLLRKKNFVLTPVFSANRISLLIINRMLKDALRAKEPVEEMELSETVAEDVSKTTPPLPPPPPKARLKKQKN